jgi:hypothetical protein
MFLIIVQLFQRSLTMFALFAYDGYYPAGGAHDFQGWFFSREHALDGIKSMYKEGRYWDHYDLAETSFMAVQYSWSRSDIEEMIRQDHEREACAALEELQDLADREANMEFDD